MQDWQDSWACHSQHGFRRGHGCDDVILDVFTQMEDALMDGSPLYGLALDFAKCFDRVPQQLTLQLLRDMGLHERILRPIEDKYARLVRRFRLPLGVGRPFKVTNGILQGCRPRQDMCLRWCRG